MQLHWQKYGHSHTYTHVPMNTKEKLKNRKIWLCNCQMFHFVHQLLANFVSLPFSTEQVVYKGFLELFLWKQSPAVSENVALTVNQNSKVVAWQLNNELNPILKLFKAKSSHIILCRFKQCIWHGGLLFDTLLLYKIAMIILLCFFCPIFGYLYTNIIKLHTFGLNSNYIKSNFFILVTHHRKYYLFYSVNWQIALLPQSLIYQHLVCVCFLLEQKEKHIREMHNIVSDWNWLNLKAFDKSLFLQVWKMYL